MKYSNVITHHEQKLSTSPYFNVVHKMNNAVKALEKLSMNKNPLETDEAHISKVAKSALKLKTQAEIAKEQVYKISVKCRAFVFDFSSRFSAL